MRSFSAKHLLVWTTGLAGVMAAVSASATMLLTPQSLHPLAEWNGTRDNGLMVSSGMTTLIDNNPATTWHGWDSGYGNADPTLTSPRPFVVTQVEVVGAADQPDRGAGYIEILPVGQGTYISTGVHIPNTLTAGQTWSASLPAQYQIPISGIRLNPDQYWLHLASLNFYGNPLGSSAADVTLAGTLRTSPGTESPAGSLRNGVLENDTSGYHANPETHKIVVDFGATPQWVNYVAFNANAYWKFPMRSVGSPTTPFNLTGLTAYSDYVNSTYAGVGGTDNPGHSWVIMPINNGVPTLLYGAGFEVNNYWGDVSEFVLLNVVPEPSVVALLALGGLLLRRSEGRRQKAEGRHR